MRKLIAVLTSFVVLFSSIEPISAACEGNSKAYVLMEASTQTVLDGENTELRLNVGYLSKLMTILLIAEDIETQLDRQVTICMASLGLVCDFFVADEKA